MESTDSSSCSQQPRLPPGFRFHPTDEELVIHYLKKKVDSAPLPVSIIAEVDLYKFDPWELPSKANFGEQEWYFFSPRDRKYPNGARPNRAATSGYWKATGTDKPIVTAGGTQRVGVKKALVFYGGKPPKGIKTNWIMHEYRLSVNLTSKSTPSTATALKPPKKASLRLDDWVLCRIYQKNGNGQMRAVGGDQQEREGCMETMKVMMDGTYLQLNPKPAQPCNNRSAGALAPTTTNDAALLDNDENFFEGLLADDTATTVAGARYSSLSSGKPIELSAAVPIAKRGLTTMPFYQQWNLAKRFQSTSTSNEENGERGRDSRNGDDSLHPIASTIFDQMFRQAPYHMSGVNWSS